MKLKNLYIVLGASVILSCSSIDPKIPIPSYIHTDSIHLKTTYSTQGTASSNITDAWVTVNNQNVGTFEMPSTFPVLYSGPNNTVSFDAVIKIDGISSNRGEYPFYQQSTLNNVTLTPGQKITINPTVNYLPSTIFAWMDDFEGSNQVQSSIISNPYDVGDTVLKLDTKPGDAFQGSGCGVVNLAPTTANPEVVFEGITAPTTGFALPGAGAPVYLELNYRCNNSFTVGLYAGPSPSTVDLATPIPVLNINPSSKWNKIYINLTPGIANVTSATNFVIYFYMTPDIGISAPYLYLDNIKLLHF